MTELKVLGKLPSSQKCCHGSLFMMGLSALGIHSCVLKLHSPKNVNASEKSCHSGSSVTYLYVDMNESVFSLPLKTDYGRRTD